MDNHGYCRFSLHKSPSISASGRPGLRFSSMLACKPLLQQNRDLLDQMVKFATFLLSSSHSYVLNTWGNKLLLLPCVSPGLSSACLAARAPPCVHSIDALLSQVQVCIMHFLGEQGSTLVWNLVGGGTKPFQTGAQHLHLLPVECDRVNCSKERKKERSVKKYEMINENDWRLW